MDKAKTKKILNIVLNVVLWIFLAFAAFTTVIAISASSSESGIPQIGGRVLMSVNSGSMEPEFYQGDLIICDVLTEDEKQALQVGDVISFNAGDLDGDGESDFNTHKITEINLDSNGKIVSFVTQGVAEGASTETVTIGNVLAKWTGTRLAGIGTFISFLQTPTGFLCLIVLPLALLFIYQIFVLVRAVLKVKNSGKRQITAADEELIKQRAVEEYLRQQAEKNSAGGTADAVEQAEASEQPDGTEQTDSAEQADAADQKPEGAEQPDDENK